MMHLPSRAALCALAILAVTATPASAQTRAAGSTITYDVTQGAAGPGMPSGATNTTTLSFNIDRIDPDGSAHANATTKMAHVSSGDSPTFEATIMPSGAIVLKYDPNMRPHFSLSKSYMRSISGNQMAQQLQIEMDMANFNGFAGECSKRTLRTGMSWQGTTIGMMPTAVRYKVTGRQQQAGHDVFVVSMQTGSGGIGSTSGLGYYDPAARLVVGLHSVMTAAANGQGTVADFTLKP